LEFRSLWTGHGITGGRNGSRLRSDPDRGGEPALGGGASTRDYGGESFGTKYKEGRAVSEKEEALRGVEKRLV